jgi:tRNA pseudouridine32 synthase / 23S rRNA pseudouridine746 synthase
VIFSNFDFMIPLPPYDPPAECPEHILYSDKDFVVYNKPAGLLTIPGSTADRQDSVLLRLQKQFQHVYMINRLDAATSGLVVAATRKNAERNLKLQWQERNVRKIYWAWVEGVLERDSGMIQAPLCADPERPPLQMVSYEQGKQSCTQYKVLQTENNRTLVELILHTGRSHQIRVHMLHIGHPVLGDPFYTPADVKPQTNRMMLHAAQLEFFHPFHRKPVVFHAPWDDAKKAFLVM